MTKPHLPNNSGPEQFSDDNLPRHHRWGAIAQASGPTRFRLWAPLASHISLEIQRRDEIKSIAMQPQPEGWHVAEVDQAPPGTRYRFRLPSGEARPDPASRYQPSGVHGWSQVVDHHSFQWHDAAWRGLTKSQLILYELQVGCFTTAGTFAAAIDRFDELVDLGVTAIELMPIADTPGRWNWGYDGVGLFAPRHTYGTPDELKTLVDEAHQRGLSVLLDVVYNHFGPEGNYWGEYGSYLATRHTTPWGSAPNFDGEGSKWVRDFFCANASYWIEEFHLDGLRLDAVHCLRDDTNPHIIAEVAREIQRIRQQVDRELHLIAESNVYDPDLLQPFSQGGQNCDALWCDDFIHSVFAILRPGDHMSARQYQSHIDLHTTLQRGFVFQGTLREPRRRVPPDEVQTTGLAPIDSLVFAIQNHDFIGNHPLGRRLHQITSTDAQMAAAALLLLYPAIPMLFMGEEFASEQPFFFFVDFGDQHLRDAVESGRKAEHPQHNWSDVASLLSDEAFLRSKIGPFESGDAVVRQWYQQLIALRKQWHDLGILSPDNLTASWNEEGHYARLSYGSEQERFVVVRLHPPNTFPPRIKLHGVEALLASKHCTAVPDGSSREWFLGEYGVAIGIGSLNIEQLD